MLEEALELLDIAHGPLCPILVVADLLQPFWETLSIHSRCTQGGSSLDSKMTIPRLTKVV